MWGVCGVLGVVPGTLAPWVAPPADGRGRGHRGRPTRPAKPSQSRQTKPSQINAWPVRPVAEPSPGLREVTGCFRGGGEGWWWWWEGEVEVQGPEHGP